jgi:hypothetical protein
MFEHTAADTRTMCETARAKRAWAAKQEPLPSLLCCPNNSSLPQLLLAEKVLGQHPVYEQISLKHFIWKTLAF